MIDSVRLTVCPSHAGIMSKRLKLRSWGLHWRIAPWLYSFIVVNFSTKFQSEHRERGRMLLDPWHSSSNWSFIHSYIHSCMQLNATHSPRCSTPDSLSGYLWENMSANQSTRHYVRILLLARPIATQRWEAVGTVVQNSLQACRGPREVVSLDRFIIPLCSASRYCQQGLHFAARALRQQIFWQLEVLQFRCCLS